MIHVQSLVGQFNQKSASIRRTVAKGQISQTERIDKMRDEMDSRLWDEHGADLTATIAKAFNAVGVSLKRLNEIEFEAPWRTKPHQGR